MAKHSKAEEARQGVVDSVKGKAKEIAGAVTDNDSLTAEGQLQQSAAKERRAASSAEAVADAQAEDARADAAEARRDGAEARGSVQARTDAVENTVSAQQGAQKLSAEHTGHRIAAGAQTRAEIDAQSEVDAAKADEGAEVGAAVADVADAVDERQRAVQDAADAKAEAARLRQQADQTQESS